LYTLHGSLELLAELVAILGTHPGCLRKTAEGLIVLLQLAE
jgi:hypothetical protein